MAGGKRRRNWTLRRPVIPDWPNEKFAFSTSRRRLAGGNHNPVSAMELRAGIEPAAFRLRNGYSARLSYRSACQPPENVEVSRHPAAVWPDVFSHGTDERQPLWAVPDALSQPGSVGSFRKGDWSRSTDSNREHAAYKAAALPLRYCGLFPPSAISGQDGPCQVHRRRNTTAVNGIAPELPILKQTLIPNDLLSRSRGRRSGHSHRSKMRFPQPSKAATSSPERVFPCRPGRLRGTYRRVQLRAQWTVGERFGRSGIRLLPQDTSWSVLALFKHAHLPARQPLCQLVAAPCPRHRHFSHCHPQRRTLGNWWRRSDLNAQLPACKAGTLPLSYVPKCVWRVIERPFSVCRGGHCT